MNSAALLADLQSTGSGSTAGPSSINSTSSSSSNSTQSTAPSSSSSSSSGSRIDSPVESNVDSTPSNGETLSAQEALGAIAATSSTSSAPSALTSALAQAATSAAANRIAAAAIPPLRGNQLDASTEALLARVRGQTQQASLSVPNHGFQDPTRQGMFGGLQQHFGSAPTMGLGAALPNLAANGWGSAHNIGGTTSVMASGLAALNSPTPAFANSNHFGAGPAAQNWQQALAQANFHNATSLNAPGGYLPHVGMSSQAPQQAASQAQLAFLLGRNAVQGATLNPGAWHTELGYDDAVALATKLGCFRLPAFVISDVGERAASNGYVSLSEIKGYLYGDPSAKKTKAIPVTAADDLSALVGAIASRRSRRAASTVQPEYRYAVAFAISESYNSYGISLSKLKADLGVKAAVSFDASARLNCLSKGVNPTAYSNEIHQEAISEGAKHTIDAAVKSLKLGSSRTPSFSSTRKRSFGATGMRTRAPLVDNENNTVCLDFLANRCERNPCRFSHKRPRNFNHNQRR